MKKMLVYLMLGAMICSFTGCGSKDGGKEQQKEEAVQEATTPATILLADYKEKVKAGDLKTTEELANAVIANELIPFAGATMPVEEGFLNGFTEEIKGFEEGTMFGPMIGSIPFVGYVFKVEKDADAFVESLKKAADLRWNICTQADEMVCEAVDGTVFFVMAPASFEEEGE